MGIFQKLDRRQDAPMSGRTIVDYPIRLDKNMIHLRPLNLTGPCGAYNAGLHSRENVVTYDFARLRVARSVWADDRRKLLEPHLHSNFKRNAVGNGERAEFHQFGEIKVPNSQWNPRSPM
jgi:hypothetical protein